jgi:glucosamine--fructose-6-phosphate aminotransferase (isomerizing)
MQHQKITNVIGICLLFLAAQVRGVATASPGSRNDDPKETAKKAKQSESSRLPAVHLDSGYFVRDGKRFFPVGAHWVPSKAAIHWPVEWDPKEIEADFAKMHELGYNIVRLDMLWPWFEPRPGDYNPAAFQQLDYLVSLAHKCRIYLHPSFIIDGEVGEEYWDATALVVAVSQSGQSAEIVRLLEVNEGKSPIIAITNTADSPLALQANATILTRAGKESSVSCKTYVTALMALQWFGRVLCGSDLGPRLRDLSSACPATRNNLAHWKDHVSSLFESMENIEGLFLVGRGPSLAVVGKGALIIKESTHFHAEGMSSAAFRHGLFEMLNARIFVLVFAGESKIRWLNQRLLEDVRNKHGRAALVAEDLHPGRTALPAASAATRPILEILPVQMITVALAAQAGREPGRFELASKVTTNE